MDQKPHIKKAGFIALMSAILISVVLMGLTLMVSASGFFSRFSVLHREFKRVSLGLAESCAHAALLKIGQNYNYAPPPGADIVPVGAESCSIKSVTYMPDPPRHQETATILTQASYRGAFSTIQVSATIQDPTLAPVTPPLANIVIGAWQEVPE